MNCLFSYFFTGEHDVRVLTLAEQFIAAMPDHIKVDSSTLHNIYYPVIS